MKDLTPLKTEIEKAYDQVTQADSQALSTGQIELIESVIECLDRGQIRVAEKLADTKWVVHTWVKKAILLYFRTQKMELSQAGDFAFFDKIPVKKWDGSEGVRSVPFALARRGSFIERGAILMPSYVNIGAYVGEGTMVDTWATVGSCAHIGKGVHLSGGVGIGGVLEPLQAEPVIIEDHAFLGSRAIVVEGVRVEEGAVLGAGVILTASTKIIDVTENPGTVYQGRVPAQSVVIPGTTQKEFPAGEFGVPCALIIGQRKPSTDKKTSLNQALRDFQVSV